MTILAVLIFVEIGTRLIETKLSADLVHIMEIPRIVNRLASEPDTKLLFLGNSLTRRGIDEELFRGEMNNTRKLTSARVFPDDTNILEWSYAYHHFIVREEHQINVLIVGFAQNQLEDTKVTHPRRLSHYYTSWNDVGVVFCDDITQFEGQAEFMIARFSKSFANAARVRRRVLDSCIPYYRESAHRMHRSVGQPSKIKNKHEPPTYKRLQRLIALTHETGTKLVVLAIPVGEPYPLEPGLRHLLAREHVPLLDGRDVKGIFTESFPDGYHMDESAAKVFTRFVASRLMECDELFENLRPRRRHN